MTQVAGADGLKAGWFVTRRNVRQNSWQPLVEASSSEASN
jgi:hypothetical protein